LITTYCIDGDCCKNPINVYGVTKLAGEKAWSRFNYNQDSWVYSSFGSNFVKTMSKLMQERIVLTLCDQMESNLRCWFGAGHHGFILTNRQWQPVYL
jgi:dTDP-4-dehydrorhamnose reductase